MSDRKIRVGDWVERNGDKSQVDKTRCDGGGNWQFSLRYNPGPTTVWFRADDFRLADGGTGALYPYADLTWVWKVSPADKIREACFSSQSFAEQVRSLEENLTVHKYTANFQAEVIDSLKKGLNVAKNEVEELRETRDRLVEEKKLWLLEPASVQLQQEKNHVSRLQDQVGHLNRQFQAQEARADRAWNCHTAVVSQNEQLMRERDKALVQLQANEIEVSRVKLLWETASADVESLKAQLKETRALLEQSQRVEGIREVEIEVLENEKANLKGRLTGEQILWGSHLDNLDKLDRIRNILDGTEDE